MSTPFKPIYLVAALGEYAVMPDGAIINVGGVSGPTFTVGGKPLLFADGTPTDGLSTGGLTIDLQKVYNNSFNTGLIELVAGKDFVLKSTSGNEFRFDATSGDITIGGDVVGFDLSSILQQTQLHLDQTTPGIRHPASHISVDRTQLNALAGNTVQEVLESVETLVSSGVRGFEHVQTTPATTWTVSHGQNTRRVQISIWDDNDELLFSDEVKITDANTVSVEFNSPVTGRAVLMLF